jgi:hypothetical protein
MDSSKVRPKVTAGLDIGDRYACLCLIDQETGQFGRQPARFRA